MSANPWGLRAGDVVRWSSPQHDCGTGPVSVIDVDGDPIVEYAAGWPPEGRYGLDRTKKYIYLLEDFEVERVAPVPVVINAPPARGTLEYARNSATRKGQPIATGVLAYWPKTMAALSEVSRRGNDKHNPGEPLHWAREKSTDEADCTVRHIVDALEADARGEPGGVMALNEDGSPHLLSALWRLNSWCERVLCGDERWRTVAKASAPASARTPTDGEIDELVRNRDRYEPEEFRRLMLALCGVELP